MSPVLLKAGNDLVLLPAQAPHLQAMFIRTLRSKLLVIVASTLHLVRVTWRFCGSYEPIRYRRHFIKAAGIPVIVSSILQL